MITTAFVTGIIFGFWIAKTDGGRKDLIEEIKKDVKKYDR